MVPPPALQRLAALQDGVVSRAQCLEHGMRPDQVRSEVTGRRWQLVHRGVYATFTGPLAARAQLGAAVLAAGEGARLIRRSALWVPRPRGPMPPVEVGIPDRRPRLVVPGLTVVRMRDLPPVTGWPPRTPAERSLLDATDCLSDPGKLVSLVCEVVGDRRTTPARLLEELATRPRHRHRRRLERLLADVDEGAHSALELADLRNDRAHGLPRGRRQVARRVDGVTQWLDVTVCMTGPSGAVVLVKELDGRLGHEGVGRFRDMHRDNVSTMRGASTLRFGWTDYEVRRCEVATLQVAFWAGRGIAVGRPCGAGCAVIASV